MIFIAFILINNNDYCHYYFTICCVPTGCIIVNKPFLRSIYKKVPFREYVRKRDLPININIILIIILKKENKITSIGLNFDILTKNKNYE